EKKVDEEYIERIEELMIEADFGINVVEKLVRELSVNKDIRTRRDAELFLRERTYNILKTVESPLALREKPLVVMMVGTNGGGKTTTIAKLSSLFVERGKSVLLGACDTFRAAAIGQLEEWAKRVGVSVIRQQEGSDPSAVAYDTVKSGFSKNIDVVILDTAGRMHTKKNLMEEMKKMKRVVKKVIPSAPQEILLILDATTGQNAISQAKEFNKALDITGIILTKMDGTSRGGIIVAIADELHIPVKYIGIGQELEDIKGFDARQFTDALFAT
ncbi:MAG: signal recognition particle-docking protein FtsY, partial [Deltaproteobacteria bacterium]|nr:signal recognition particle-docking protein FtsY [Deltaproteobacteria bacterium]